MSYETIAQLRARIAELEAENETLQGLIVPVASRPKKRTWGWTLLATTLIVIGALLSPIAVVGSWINLTLTDTDRFVAAYGPLAQDPEVQGFIATQVVKTINEQVDVPALTSDVIDGIVELGTSPVASTALEALKGPAAQGIQGLIQSSVDGFISSDQFATVWSQTLRISHQQLVLSMQGNSDGLINISGNGEIGIALAPIIGQVKVLLIDQGFTFASAIPEVDRMIVLAQSDEIPKVQLAYNVAVSSGYWLPLVALALFIVGVLVARRRSVALIWAAVALAMGMGITLGGLGASNILFVSAVTPAGIPMPVANILFHSVAGAMQASALGVLVIALGIAVVTWLAGPFETTRKLRSLAQSGSASVRGAAEKRNLSTGRFGEWLYRQRLLLRIVIAVIAGAIVFFARPVDASLVIWTLIIGAVVVGILELLQRPVAAAPKDATKDATKDSTKEVSGLQ